MPNHNRVQVHLLRPHETTTGDCEDRFKSSFQSRKCSWLSSFFSFGFLFRTARIQSWGGQSAKSVTTRFWEVLLAYPQIHSAIWWTLFTFIFSKSFSSLFQYRAFLVCAAFSFLSRELSIFTLRFSAIRLLRFFCLVIPFHAAAFIEICNFGCLLNFHERKP